jgi:iron(III) transport system ATP-binding protein
MSLLSLRGVSKRYGDVVAVSDVDLDIAEGSRTVIVGPSGCGKTTLLRLIAGFEQLSGGRIALGGKVLAEPEGAVPAHARGIGYVTQDGALFPHLDVAANIGFGLGRGLSGRATRVAELMRAVGLDPSLGSRRPHELSGGQQQRVALARALARRPALMLLDEPFSALDAGLRDSMRDMVGEVLAAASMTTILVTHDRAEALSFASDLAVLRDGRVVQAGAPTALYRQPADPETAVFLGDAIILDAVLEDGFAECAVGRVAVDSARSGPAKIMLRPEQVSVRRTEGDPAALGSAVLGRVVASSFRGSSFRVIVAIGPTWERPLAPELPKRLALTLSSPEAFEPGTPVALLVSGSAHVFG